jgi:hypothetical protein
MRRSAVAAVRGRIAAAQRQVLRLAMAEISRSGRHR